MIRPISLTIFATFLGQALNFISDLLIAGHFGTSWKADAFFLALVIPIMISDLLIAGINAVFIPSYVSYEKKGRGEEFFNTFTNVTMLIALVAAFLIFISSEWLIGLVGGGFSVEAKELSAAILRLLVILILTLPLAGLLSSRLNAHNSFALPALGKSFYFGGVILALLVFRDVLGIVSLPMGYAAGSLLFIALLVALIRGSGLGYSFRTDFSHPALKESAILLAPFIVMALFNNLNILIERSIASRLSEGSISALNYAFKLVNIPVNFFVLAGVTVASPALAKCASDGDFEGLRNIMLRGLCFVSFLIMPLSIAIAVLRGPIIKLLFERGEFGEFSVTFTSSAVFFYSFGIVWLSCTHVLYRVFFAMKEMKLLGYIGVLITALNIVLMFLLSGILGVKGLPLAFSISAAAHMIALSIWLNKQLKMPFIMTFFKAAARHLAASAIMGTVCLGLLAAYSDWSNHPSASSLMGFLAIAALISAASYLGASLALGVYEVKSLASKLRDFSL